MAIKGYIRHKDLPSFNLNKVENGDLVIADSDCLLVQYKDSSDHWYLVNPKTVEVSCIGPKDAIINHLNKFTEGKGYWISKEDSYKIDIHIEWSVTP